MVEFVIAREFREIWVWDKDNEEIHYDNTHDQDSQDSEKEITIVEVVKRHYRQRRWDLRQSAEAAGSMIHREVTERTKDACPSSSTWSRSSSSRSRGSWHFPRASLVLQIQELYGLIVLRHFQDSFRIVGGETEHHDTPLSLFPLCPVFSNNFRLRASTRNIFLWYWRYRYSTWTYFVCCIRIWGRTGSIELWMFFFVVSSG